MQQQQLASIIEYSNAIHVQPPTKTICVGTYRSSTIINFSQLVIKYIKISYSNQTTPLYFYGLMRNQDNPRTLSLDDYYERIVIHTVVFSSDRISQNKPCCSGIFFLLYCLFGNINTTALIVYDECKHSF